MNDQPSIQEIVDHIAENFDYEIETGESILAEINQTMDIAQVAKDNFPVMAHEKQPFEEGNDDHWRDITLYGDGEWCVAIELDCKDDGSASLMSYGFFGNGPGFSQFLDSIKPADAAPVAAAASAEAEPEAAPEAAPEATPEATIEAIEEEAAAPVVEEVAEEAVEDEDLDEDDGYVEEGEDDASLLDMMANESSRVSPEETETQEAVEEEQVEPAAEVAAEDVNEVEAAPEQTAPEETVSEGDDEAIDTTEPQYQTPQPSSVRAMVNEIRGGRGNEPYQPEPEKTGFFSKLFKR